MKLSIKQKKIKAELKRKEYFKFFDNNGIRYASNNLSKPYLNKLSPGCLTCIKGIWSCVYINTLCTKNCFFCPQDRTKNKEAMPKSDLSEFKSSDKYVKHLKKFNFSGISFSGGEPFLVFDKLIKYIKKIRKTFGKKYYIWVYTNGDLITEKKLQLLNKIGLNEIRFNIAARNYDLKPVKIAVKYIKNVTVEIPTIPEDLNILKILLPKLESVGVKYLNLHQLYVTKYNSENISKKKYTIIKEKDGLLPVLESELSAFELLEYAIKIKSKIGINYCSKCYKERFQSKGNRMQLAPFLIDEFDDITNTGFIRKLLVKCQKNNLNKFLNDSNLNKSEYKLIKKGNVFEIIISSKKFLKIFKKIVEIGKEVNIKYYSHVEKKQIRRNNEFPFSIMEFGSLKLKNESSLIMFKKLFIENKKLDKVINEILKLYGHNKIMKETIIKDIKSFYIRFSKYEYLPNNLQPYA